ncbi:histidine kinase, partial [Vibrio sp. FNV 38]|nr:histidine kinase [Vibrio sp. FNV 38]
IPLLIATIYYFYHNINRPIGSLVEASKHIEEGEYGYQIEEFHRNGEFERLINTFNHMSGSLEDSFNRIYAEEVAARDANMKALQAQINPHFLNNTLEIINWKARLSGNEDVSKMISSLSTMMNATMNRKNEAFITIEEEMK